MAEGILRKRLADAGCDGVRVSSAGMSTLNGYSATPNAVEIAARNGIDISDHHSMRMTRKVFEESDLVFALAEGHYERLKEFPNPENKLYMVKAFPETGQADAAHSVADPVGGTLEEYKSTFEEIEQEIKRALPEIKRRINHQ
jgi:protein-tyrosine phosphatase